MKGEHLNFDQRKIINSCLSQNKKLCEIATLLDMDPTSISKEIKRNRILTKEGIEKKKYCKKTLRYPYCCNGCNLKYSTCPFNQFKYDSKTAQDKANYRLINSRKGLNITKEDFLRVDAILKNGNDNKQSIYHIVKSNENMPSIPTIYRWIRNGYTSLKWLDLPYAKTYKVRKKDNKKYDCHNNSIDRSNHTFLDYLAFRRNYPGKFSIQMGFLGSIKSDSKDILTLTIPEIHFVYLRIFYKPKQITIKELYDWFEDILGIECFKKIFPCILTDREPVFQNYLQLEFSDITGEKRTNVFYCDSFKSVQKGNVENMNKQLRKFIPKRHTIDHLKESDIKQINKILLERKVESLNGYSPIEAFEKVYGKNIIEKLFTY